MSTQITPQPGIMEIALYEGGASALAGKTDVLKLSSNENPLGPSPAAVEAVKEAAANLNRYPSTDHATLRQAIAEVWGLDAAQIICGNGSGEVLKLISEAFAGPGDEVIFTEHGFSMYPIYAHSCGATPVVVAEKDRTTDVDAILAACTDKTRLVFVANPGNPTGTMIPVAELARLADGLPAQAILVLDGAYAEFVPGYDGGASLVAARENIVMTRTFSKIYGLGGLRIGWGYAPKPIIDVLNRIRGPFNIGAAALAGAEAAMLDQAYTAHCQAENARCRDRLIADLGAIGVPCDPSHANFILARFASEAEANACDDALRADGILVRRVAGYKLPECLRITVGDDAGCARVLAAIKAFKGAKP